MAPTKKLVPHSLYCSSFYYFSLLFVGYVPNKVSNNLRIRKFLFSSQSIAFGGFLKKISFSSEHFKRDISLGYIRKFGIKTYESPATQESRELIRKDNNGKIGVYC